MELIKKLEASTINNLKIGLNIIEIFTMITIKDFIVKFGKLTKTQMYPFTQKWKSSSLQKLKYTKVMKC